MSRTYRTDAPTNSIIVDAVGTDESEGPARATGPFLLADPGDERLAPPTFEAPNKSRSPLKGKRSPVGRARCAAGKHSPLNPQAHGEEDVLRDVCLYCQQPIMQTQATKVWFLASVLA
jgi:hypothetical protein